MIFTQERDKLRTLYREALEKLESGAAMEPLERQVAEVLREHPEYHEAVRDPDVVDRDYLPETGEVNPWLHMGLHLAIREQVSTDRPAGIRDIWQRLGVRLGSAHEAEHAMQEQLVESLWTAQRDGVAPDETAYLEALRRLL